MNSKAIRKQLFAAVAMVLVAAVALGSSTYAWFASNNSVKAENMNVIATSDVEFLEIQNVGTNFTGGTITVNATNTGSLTDNKLSPVTPMIVTNMDKTGSEGTTLAVAQTGTNGTNGYGDGFIWKWTTASSGTNHAKGSDNVWNYANVTDPNAKYYLLNNFKFRMNVNGVTTEKLYASEVTLSNAITSAAMDEAVRIMIVGAAGIQIYDCGTQNWTYYKADGSAAPAGTNNFSLISSVGYQADNANDQAVKVFIYYEGDDSSLFTANLNTLAGVTASITFTTGGATVS